VQTTGGHVRPRGILDDLPPARELFRGDRVELVLMPAAVSVKPAQYSSVDSRSIAGQREIGIA